MGEPNPAPSHTALGRQRSDGAGTSWRLTSDLILSYLGSERTLWLGVRPGDWGQAYNETHVHDSTAPASSRDVGGCQTTGGEGSMAGLCGCCVDTCLLLDPQICTSVSSASSHQDTHPGRKPQKMAAKSLCSEEAVSNFRSLSLSPVLPTHVSLASRAVLSGTCPQHLPSPQPCPLPQVQLCPEPAERPRRERGSRSSFKGC